MIEKIGDLKGHGYIDSQNLEFHSVKLMSSRKITEDFCVGKHLYGNKEIWGIVEKNKKPIEETANSFREAMGKALRMQYIRNNMLPTDQPIDFRPQIIEKSVKVTKEKDRVELNCETEEGLLKIKFKTERGDNGMVIDNIVQVEELTQDGVLSHTSLFPLDISFDEFFSDEHVELYKRILNPVRDVVWLENAPTGKTYNKHFEEIEENDKTISKKLGNDKSKKVSYDKENHKMTINGLKIETNEAFEKASKEEIISTIKEEDPFQIIKYMNF